MTGPAFAGAAGAAIIEAAAFTAGLGKVGTTPCACTGSVAGTLVGVGGGTGGIALFVAGTVDCPSKVEPPDNLGTGGGPFTPELLTDRHLATTIVPAGGSATLGTGEAAGDEVVDDGSDREDEEAPDA